MILAETFMVDDLHLLRVHALSHTGTALLETIVFLGKVAFFQLKVGDPK